ncbi:MAG: glycosyltransferase [Euryarchaeota archaeon]|nr:glycosyltransferase [Euryarchaeota archaeon]
MSITAVLSAFNNEVTISNVVLQTLAHADRVIVVDDGSTDGTAEKARLAGAEVIRHNINQGKEAALRTGFALAAQNGAKVIVTMDSGGRHDPADIRKLAEPILCGEADMVKGSYNGSGEGITGTNIDFRAFSRNCFNYLITEEGNILNTINEKGLKVIEVQIGHNGSKDSQSPSTMTSIGIINHKLNYLTLGSIITITKKYVEKVYVVNDTENEAISEIVRLCGAKIINVSENGNKSILKEIMQLEKNHKGKFFVTLYGDGTHDPGKIPQLVDPIMKSEFDIVVDSSSIKPDPYVNENALLFSKGKAYQKQKKNGGSGFAACSIKCLETLDFSNNGKDITKQILQNAKNANLKVKYLHFDTNQPSGLLDMYDIGVVVPAYNEELLIEETINGIPKYVNKIYIIDDCSRDRTPEIIKGMTDPRIVSIRHEKNKGVGAAIVTGYKQALEDNMDIVAVMAGDNQIDPEQLPRLLMPIIEGKADYTKGNRLLSKDFRSGMSEWRSIGNGMLTLITKIGSGYWHIMDPQNGYAAISKNALEVIDLDSIYPYYGYCNDMLVKLNTFEMRVMDIVMPARYGRERSKIKYSSYIMKVAPMIFRRFLWRLKTKYMVLDFHPLVFFYIASMVLVPAGVLFGVWIFHQKWNRIPVSVNYPLLDVFILLMGLLFLLFAMLFDMQADNSRRQMI